MDEEASPMIMVPEGSDTSFSEPQVRARGRPKKDGNEPDKAWREVIIALKLLVGGGIDSTGHLLDDEHKIVPNADFKSFLNYTVTKGRARIGEEAYIRALQRARIPIDWITNDDIRMKVLNYRKSYLPKRKLETITEDPPRPIQIHTIEENPVDTSEPPPPKISGPFPKGSELPDLPRDDWDEEEGPEKKKRKRNWEELDG